MVLGIGEGSLEVKLDKTNFMPGEAITGRVRLQLNEPKEARELRVEFYGEIRSGKHHRIVHQQRIQLSGARTYRPGEELPFSITIPRDVYPAIPTGFIGDLVNFFTPTPSWYVNLSLDLPMKLDCFRILQIQIAKPPRSQQPAQAAPNPYQQGGTQKTWGL